MKVISIYPNFANRGGAQDVVIQLAKALNETDTDPIVLTDTPNEQIYSEYRDGITFLPFSLKNVLSFTGSDVLFMSHSRKTTSQLVILNKFIRKIRIIHIAHNTFSSLKYLSFFPEDIIAVSNGVKENLISYFKVPEKNITVIYNGIRDIKTTSFRETRSNVLCGEGEKYVNILLAGRICDVKQQVEIVRQTKNRLNENIRFYFVGVGHDSERLKSEIGQSSQYIYLGYRNVPDIIAEFDYICLFSKKEGLGITLIEGCAVRKPLITNDIPSVLDVNENGKTGFVYHDFDALIDGINSLPLRDSSHYQILSENARKKFEKYFTEEVMIKGYRKYIDRLICK